MRELLDLESWANNLINEAGKDRPLTLDRDIQAQAIRKYPDRNPEQAMSLFVADKLSNQEKLDYEQNKIINTQKRDNDKLRRSVQDLSKELHDHENQAQQTDREVARLKDLSAKLKPAGEIAQVAAKANADQVQAMLKDLDQVKNNPKINDQQFKEISDKVKQLQNAGNGEEVQKTQETLRALANTQELDKEQYDRALDALEKSYRENIAKEKRFQASTKRNAEMKGSWGIKFKDLNDKIKQIETKANSVKELDDFYNGVLARADDVEAKTDELENTAYQVQDQVERLYDLIAKVNNINPLKLKIPQHPAGIKDPPIFQQNQIANQPKISTNDPTNQPQLAESNPMISFTDEEPQGYDNLIENAIDELIPWFAYKYPEYMDKFPEDQLRKIMRRTIGAGLMIYGSTPTENEIYRYLERVAVLLNREAEKIKVQVPTTDPRQQKLNFQESLLKNFSNSLDKLTKI